MEMKRQANDVVTAKVLKICIDQAADMERQMRSAQLDVENLQRELTSVTCERETAIQQNRRLEDDLAAMSCEVRNMRKELEASKVEAHDLKRQLQTYVCEVRRAEDLLSQKENERTEMLNHFRSLSLEASVLENNNHSLESEAAEVRGALQATQDQICDLERQLTDKNCLIRGYEDQITELSQNVASLEIQLQQVTDERQRTEDDLRTARDLCMTLEQQKECLSQRLCETSDLKNKYELQIEQYKTEQDIFQEQMNRDHSTIDHLEKILENTRKDTMNSQTTNRELNCEVTRLKQKICELQNKLSLESTELRKYQSQTAEYSSQICELRRQINNERFEKAKKQEFTQSPALKSYKSESPNKKETTCPKVSSRPICCLCNKSDDSSNQHTHRCSTFDTPKNNEIHAMYYNKDGICNLCREQKFGKTKVISSSDGVCPVTGKKSCSYKTIDNSIVRYEEEKQEVSRSNNLCKNSLSGAKEINCHHVKKACYHNENNANGNNSVNINSNCQMSKNSESKKINIESFLSEQSLINSKHSSESLSRMNCGCRDKIKNVQSPCWILQTLNALHKLLEEKEKVEKKKFTTDESTQIKANELTSEQNTQTDRCPSITNNTNENSNYNQRHESGIYTGNFSKSCFTQTEDNHNIPNPSQAHLLQILAEIQHYAENINKYFKELKQAPKFHCHQAQQCFEFDDEFRGTNLRSHQKPLTIKSNQNTFVDESLPVERLSKLSSSLHFDNIDELRASTPKTSFTKSKKSAIPIITESPRSSNHHIQKLPIDEESPQWNNNNNFDMTEYKALPIEMTNKTSKSSKFSKVFKCTKSEISKNT